MRFADLKNDFVFRRIFAHHPELTAALLNDLLALEGPGRIVSLVLVPPEQAPVVAGAKLSILDVRCRAQDGTYFVVEMQLLHVAGFLNRVVFNACKAYVGQLGQGQGYRTLEPVVAVSVCNFVIWPDALRRAAGEVTVPLVSQWVLSEQTSGAQGAGEGLGQVRYAFLELPKVAQEGPLATPAEQWAWLFVHAVDLEHPPPGLSEAQQQVLALANEATFTADEQEAYRRVVDEIEQARQLAEDAEARGEARGLRDGMAQGLAPLVRQFTRRLGRALTESETSTLHARLVSLGPERLGDVVLDLVPDALAAWLADGSAS